MGMTGTSFRLNVGALKCTVISDGFITVPSPPPPGFSGRPEDRPREKMDVCCLIIDTDKHRILVDTGCGSVFQSSAGKLWENLAGEGIKRESVDTIVYTHAHPDHIGGTFDPAGKLAFPKARQIMAKKEWDSFSGPEDGPAFRMFTLARKTLLPIQDQISLVDDTYEVTDGVRLLPARGHTLGGVLIEVASGKDRMLCIGDLIQSQIEFTLPGFYSFLDSAPGDALTLRTDGLSRMAKAGTLIFACHMPFPGIGRFVKAGGVLGWQPL
jgi:glyoxylase-like metal-dependent hydrolase (beta-lactamase superfamily II)